VIDIDGEHGGAADPLDAPVGLVDHLAQTSTIGTVLAIG
jgi:hypothetical protein